MNKIGRLRRVTASLVLSGFLVVGAAPTAFGNHETNGLDPVANTPEVWTGWVAYELTNTGGGPGHTNPNGSMEQVTRGWWVDTDPASRDIAAWSESNYWYQMASDPTTGWCQHDEFFGEGAGQGGGSNVYWTADLAHQDWGNFPYATGTEGLLFQGFPEGSYGWEGRTQTCDGYDEPSTPSGGAGPNGGEKFAVPADMSALPQVLTERLTYEHWAAGGADNPYYVTHSYQVCMTRATADGDGDGLPDEVDLAPTMAGSLSDLGTPGGPGYETIPAKLVGGPSGKKGVPNCPASEPPPTPCVGLDRPDVVGREPSYVSSGRKLSSFPNKDAACAGMWAPHLDGGFVPQGIAPTDGGMWVAGYIKAHEDDKPVECAVYLMDPETGRRGSGYVFTKKHLTAASTDSGFVKLRKCGHAGGVAVLPDGRLLVVDTKTIFVLDARRFGQGNPIDEVIKLVDPFPDDEHKFNGSFLVDGTASSDPEVATMWIGTWSESSASTLRRFSVAEILADNTRRPGDDDLTAMLSLPSDAQGAAFAPTGELLVASSVSRCGRLSLLDVETGTIDEYGFGPGVEEISFVDGKLWATFEAGSRLYIEKFGAKFFPLVASFDPSKITEGPESIVDNKFCVGL